MGRKGRRLLLVLILLLAAGARFWSIGFGLPHTRSRPDESKIVRILQSPWGSFHPGTLRYPSLYRYLVLGLDGAYYAAGRASGRFGDVADLMAEYAVDPQNLYLLSRVLAAVLGVATVLALRRAASIDASESTALAAAFFLALTHLHVRDSHFGVTDVPMTFFIVCSTVFLLRARSDPRLRNYVLGGLFCGLSASTKYSGLFLFAPMIVVHVLGARDAGRGVLRSLLDRRLIAFGVASALFFLLGTPHSVLDSARFLRDLAGDSKHFATGHGMVLERGWTYHVTYTLPLALGWPLFVAALAGIAHMLRTDLRRALVLGAFPLVYYLVSGAGHAVFLRYTIPLLPFLCIFAAHFVEVLARRLGRGAALPFAWGLAVLLVVPSAVRIVATNRLLGREDTRNLAAEWVLENVEAGSSIHQISTRSARVQLPRSFEELEREHVYLTVRWGTGWIERALPERAATAGRFEEWEWDEEGGRFLRDGRPMEASPDYLIVTRSPLERYTKELGGLEERLDASYTEVRAFRAAPLDEPRNLYDPIDAFYLPFAGFEDVERPGPNVHVYARSPEEDA